MRRMLFADNPGVASMSADGLARMTAVIVEGFGEFGPTVSEKTKTLLILMRINGDNAEGRSP